MKVIGAVLVTGVISLATIAGAGTLKQDSFSTVEQLVDAQESYFAKQGRYLQVLDDGSLPPKEKGTAKEKLGKKTPYRVDVYETARGEHGYSVTWEDEVSYHTQGFGPEAESRTFTLPKPEEPLLSSSTLSALPLGSDLFSELIARITPVAQAFTTNTHSTTLAAASSQYWSHTDVAAFDVTGDLSMSMWVKFTTVPALGDGMFLAGKANIGPNVLSYYFYVDDSLGQKRIHFVAGSTGGTWSDALVNTTLTTGTWYQLGVTYNTSGSSNVKFYQDGAQVGASQTNANTGIYDGTASFMIGHRNDGVYNLDAKVDDYRLWSRELSSTEMGNMYSDPCNVSNGSSLNAWYLFDNNGTDSSAGGNDLTNNNTATFSTDAAYTCPAAPKAAAIQMLINSGGQLLINSGGRLIIP